MAHVRAAILLAALWGAPARGAPAVPQEPRSGESADAVEALYQRGFAAIEAGDLRAGLETMTSVLDRAPEHVEARRWRAHCHLELGEPALALADLERVAEAAPEDAWIAFARGKALLRLGRVEEALAALTRSLRLGSGVAAVHNWRGLAHSRLGREDAALADYTASIGIAPDDPWTWLARGRTRAALRDFPGAAQDLARATALAPEEPAVQAELGYLFAVGIAEERALSHLREALRLGPRADARVPLWIWILRRELGHPAEEVDAELAAWRSAAAAAAGPDLPRRLAAFLLGELEEGALIEAAVAAAADQPPVDAAAAQCELWFFVGTRRAIEGDERAAMHAWLDALRTLTTASWPWEGARARLRRLAERHQLVADLGFRTGELPADFAALARIDPSRARAILEVPRGSFADRAGLAKGDVLVEIEGRPASRAGLAEALRDALPGDVLTLGVLRAGERRELRIVLGVDA